MPIREVNKILIDEDGNIIAGEDVNYHKNPALPENPYRYGTKPIAVLENDIEATAAITNIDLGSYSEILKKGMQISVIGRDTLEAKDVFTVDTDSVTGDASVSVSSQTPDVPLKAGDAIVIDGCVPVKKELTFQAAEHYRYAEFLHVDTGNATPVEATLDGAAAGSTNRILIPSDSACLFEIKIVCKQSGSGNVATFVRRATVSNNGGTTALVGAVEVIGTDVASLALIAAAVAIGVNDPSDALTVTVTGVNPLQLRWSVFVNYVASVYG